jgi:hypothetical protein
MVYSGVIWIYSYFSLRTGQMWRNPISLAEVLLNLLIATLGAVAFLIAINPGVSSSMQQVLFSIGGGFFGIAIGGIGYRLFYVDPLWSCSICRSLLCNCPSLLWSCSWSWAMVSSCLLMVSLSEFISSSGIPLLSGFPASSSDNSTIQTKPWGLGT